MPDPQSYHFDLSATGRPSDVMLPEAWYPGVQAFWERSTSSRIYDAVLGVRAVVIHATAGSSSAGAVSVMRDGNASFHWLVPDEDEPQHGQLVWACAPEARAAWHIRNSCRHPAINGGQNRINHWSLGIEVVNRLAGGDSYSDWQIRATAWIVRYCWAKYPNLRHIVSHAMLDPDRRSDPGTHFPWATFRDLVLDGGDDGLPAVALEAVAADDLSGTSSSSGCCTP